MNEHLTLRRKLEERDAYFRSVLSFEERKKLPPWKARILYKDEEDKIIIQMHLENISGEEAENRIGELMEEYYGMLFPSMN